MTVVTARLCHCRGYYTTNRAAVGWIVVICGRRDRIRPREARDMIAGIIFLAGLLVVVFGIAADQRQVFWRDARRRSRRGGPLPLRFFWW